MRTQQRYALYMYESTERSLAKQADNCANRKRRTYRMQMQMQSAKC